MNICLQCGNEIESNKRCPYCGFQEVLSKHKKVAKLRTFNIKVSMPTCEEAIKLLSNEIRVTKRAGNKILKIIHGYGSSGKGGELRWCLREYLQMMQSRNFILTFIAGEDLSISNMKINKILLDYPILRKDKDYSKRNRGVTFIIL